LITHIIEAHFRLVHNPDIETGGNFCIRSNVTKR